MPLTDHERELFGRYLPLFQLEWHRAGIGEEDQGWIFAGGSGPITEAALESALAEYRSLPTGMGAEAYCVRIGVDYAEWKLRIASINSGVAKPDQ